MRPRLQCTNLLVQDLADQPAAPYIVIVEGILGPGSKGALAVTHYRDRDGAFVFYDGTACVLTLPYDVRWVMIARERVVAPTTEEWLRKDDADTQAIKALGKELHPEVKDMLDQDMVVPVVVMGAEGAAVGREAQSNAGHGYL